MADMQEFKLQPTAVLPEPAIVHDHRAYQALTIEKAREPAATIKAVEQQWRVMFGLTFGPALHIEERWIQTQTALFQSIDLMNDFAPVNAPDLLNFIAARCA
jgi:hypothetical protein